MLARVRTTLDVLLQWVLITLMVALTVIVVLAVIWRKMGDSFAWYDEVASIMLAWVTYYGAALAALRRGHIGFDGFVFALPPRWRLAAVAVAEVAVIGFFVVLAWTGWQVLQVLQGDALVSLTWVPVAFTQSVIPIGAALFIICEIVSLPAYWKELGEGPRTDEAAMTAADDRGDRQP